MPEEFKEPPDHHKYNWLTFDLDTFQFYLAAVKFYEELLNKDIKAIEEDPDLKLLLDANQRKTFEIGREHRTIVNLREWMEGQIRESGPNPNDYEVDITHGSIKLMKSTAFLYLGHLRQRRNVLASRPNIAKHVLEAVDQQIHNYQQKNQMGVFKLASLRQLLVDELLETPQATIVDDMEETTLHASMHDVLRPRPIVIDSIEILNAELRGRCLDLLEKFHEDGQEERLDTVVTEATRILENRLRTLSSADATCVGVDLASYCFGGDKPRLIVSAIAAEQDAAHLLFRGVFGFIRNKVHHHLLPNLDPTRVLQTIAMIDYLLFVAEGAIPQDESKS